MKKQSSPPTDWQPSADWESIKARSQLLRRIREFFYQRKVIEVETPLLSQATITDVHINPIRVNVDFSSQSYYLQTSPEYAMKRMLAAGCESIYQIGKAFRDDEVGAKHNPEFTLLEWYRVGWDHRQLIDEVADLLKECLGCDGFDIQSYYQLFQQHFQINPHRANKILLKNTARSVLDIGEMDFDDETDWLDLLFSHCIEPTLGTKRPTFVVDYPMKQAALAKLGTQMIEGERIDVAQRFEVFVAGVELANGYHELTEYQQQRDRFLAEQEKLPCQRPIDLRLLAAIEKGLPPCAGVALGVDRLLMLLTGEKCISDVLSFDFLRA